MTALIRSELIQLRTLRSTYVVALGVVALVVALTWGDLSDAKELVSAEQMRSPVLTGAGITTAFVGALLAAARVASEYRYGTIANRALAAPRRTLLLAGKLVTYSTVGMVAAVVAVGIGLATAAAVLSSKDLTLVLDADDAWRVVARVVVAGTLFTTLGAIVGFITRSQQAAVCVVFGEFFAEKLLGGLLGPATEFLPFELLNRILDESAGHAVAAGLALAAMTAALGTVAAVLLKRRDIN